MKKATLSRILGLALALVLALSTSVAFAMPSGTSAIEGLPEMPTVPTMTTAAKGYDVTITLSEPMAWLNVLQNWNWNDIITWSDDKLTGTYNTKGLKTQPGYGTWNTNGISNNWPAEWAWAWQPKEAGGDYTWLYTDIEKYKVKDGNTTIHHANHYVGLMSVHVYVPIEVEDEDNPGSWDSTAVLDIVATNEDDLNDLKKLQNDQVGICVALFPGDTAKINAASKIDDDSTQAFYDVAEAYGVYDLGGPGFYQEPGDQTPGSEWSLGYAYNGATNDGTNVYYGRFGEVVQISKDLTGVNFLGTDKTPVKTTVTWIPLNHKGKTASNYYINQITEEYEDGSKLTAHFSSSMGGKYLGSKPE